MTSRSFCPYTSPLRLPATISPRLTSTPRNWTWADFVSVDVDSPERRQYHTFISVYDEGRAILFGGKGDCGYLDDTWSFGFAEGAWSEIEPAGQGEACMRTGQEGCTDLCY